MVTLEPCCHDGKTPPCTDAIIAAKKAGLCRVIVGTRDPNPKVSGQGINTLQDAGFEVIEGKLESQCKSLIRPFEHWVRTGRPWVTVKTAQRRLEDGSETMIPLEGSTTFTSPRSLRLAHELRKRSDAILTGSGTILSDSPQFTVRHVKDHEGKVRWLMVLDRRRRVSEEWLKNASTRNFEAHTVDTLDEALDFLGDKGVLEVLVEAGPRVSQTILKGKDWNEHVSILSDPKGDDEVEYVYRDY